MAPQWTDGAGDSLHAGEWNNPTSPADRQMLTKWINLLVTHRDLPVWRRVPTTRACASLISLNRWLAEIGMILTIGKDLS